MSHRQKGSHKPRHRTHAVKPASMPPRLVEADAPTNTEATVPAKPADIPASSTAENAPAETNAA